MRLPKMNWLFRFKKVHGWNTKRGSSISPWIVRENPMAVWKEGAWGVVRCWSLIRPRASSTQGLGAQTSILSSSTSNPLNHLRQFLHCKPPFSLSNVPAYVSMNTYCGPVVYRGQVWRDRVESTPRLHFNHSDANCPGSGERGEAADEAAGRRKVALENVPTVCGGMSV